MPGISSNGTLRREQFLCCSSHALGIKAPLMQRRSAGPGAVKTHIWNKIDLCNIVKYKGTVFEASLAKFGVLMKARGTTGHASERIGRCIALQLV